MDSDLGVAQSMLSASIPDSDTLAKQISATVIQVCELTLRQSLRAIVLTGSLARNEGTFVQLNKRWKAAGDAEFLLVFQEHAHLPAAKDVQSFIYWIEARLLERDIECAISLAVVKPKYLRSLPASIFRYELRCFGRPVWGDGSVLDLIPAFPPSDIALEDAWRMLSNRMVELLESSTEMSADCNDLSPALQYRTVKLYLDMATSLLVFLHSYEPTYQLRAQRLMALAGGSGTDDYGPFPLREFAIQVAQLTRWKLHPCTENCDLQPELWQKALTYAQLLWRWELERLTCAPNHLPNRLLLRCASRQLTRVQQLRGWLYVMRREGWQRSWRYWPHWLRLARQGTPRYCIYGIAVELLGRLLCLTNRSGDDNLTKMHLDRLRVLLPVVSPVSKLGSAAWQDLAAEIVWNYKRFLVETRA